MKRLNARFLISCVLFATGLLLMACSEPEDEYTESQDEHICEHLTNGPVAMLDAATSIEEAMDSLSSDAGYRIQALLHTRFDVSFPMDSNNTYSGYIPYLPIKKDGDYILYLDQEVNVSVFNHSDGNELIAAESSMDHSDDCAAVRYRGTYHLHDTDEYVLFVSSSQAETIGMLFVPSAEDEEDHDH